MPELLILVGVQGAGKTTWYRAHLAATHVHVSKDLMVNVRNRQREGKARVPDVAIFVTSKKLVPPSLEEGLDENRLISGEAEAGGVDGRPDA